MPVLPMPDQETAAGPQWSFIPSLCVSTNCKWSRCLLETGVNQGEKWGTRHAQVQRSLGSVAWPQDQPKEGQGAGGGGSPKW